MRSLFVRAVGPFALCLSLTMPALRATAEGTAEGVFPAGDWRAVTETDLRVRPGSALDFSSLFPDQMVPGAVTIDARGRLSTVKTRRQRQRFLCAPLLFARAHGGLPDAAEADALALELRRRGYNLARFHLIEKALLNRGTEDGAGGTTIDRGKLDRFQYLMAAFKKQGIYWMIDGPSSWQPPAEAAGGGEPDREAHLLQLAVHHDLAARRHWQDRVNRILATTNPYSGLPPLRDPNLLAVTTINNGSILYNLAQPGFAQPRRRFLDWFERTYQPRSEGERLKGYVALERSTQAWMTDVLRELGFNGLVTGQNAGQAALTRLAARDMALQSLHDFFDMPVNFIRPGNTQEGTSAIAALAPDVRRIAAVRVAGSPFIADEYGHPFWSPWRRESALLMPAYAAFQDWDAICRFNNPVALSYGGSTAPRKQAITPFAVGLDPVARAGETLAALLFRRGDVRPARSRLALEPVAGLTTNPETARQALPEALPGLALRHGIGLLWRRESPAKGDANRPAGGAWDPDLRLPLATDGLTQKDANRLTALRRSLGAEETEAGRHVSDSGEIAIDAAARLARVQTERSEVVVFDRALPEPLTHLSVTAASEPALVALSSIDGLPLGESRRMLLVVATDAVNSDNRFSDARRRSLLRLGRLPVLIKSLRLDLKVRHDSPSGLTLYALGLDGARRQALPLTATGDGVALRIDTGTLEAGPTTYFELVAENSD